MKSFSSSGIIVKQLFTLTPCWHRHVHISARVQMGFLCINIDHQSLSAISKLYFHITHNRRWHIFQLFSMRWTQMELFLEQTQCHSYQHSFFFAEYHTQQPPTERAYKSINFSAQMPIDSCGGLAGLQMKAKSSLLIFRFIAGVWAETLEGECCLIYFPSPQHCISNWTFLMINWATPLRGLTPRSPTRNFHHSHRIIDYSHHLFWRSVDGISRWNAALLCSTTLTALHTASIKNLIM